VKDRRSVWIQFWKLYFLKTKKVIHMSNIVPIERIEKTILLVRGQKVMLDVDLANLYGVDNSQLKRAVRRNISRFPEGFMFVLTKEELHNLRCQFGTSKWGGTRFAWRKSFRTSKSISFHNWQNCGNVI